MSIALDDYRRLVSDTQNVLRRRLGVILDKWNDGQDDDVKSLAMWQVALVTVILDLSSSAVLLINANELRGARVLDRSLCELAFRLHYYAQRPEQALADGLQYEAFLRRVLKANPDAQGNMSDAQFVRFKKFLSAGSSELKHPKIHRLIRDTLKSLGSWQSSDLKRAMRGLEAEYAISSGIAHGSQGILADVYRTSGGKMPDLRSSWFTPRRMIMRIITDLLLALVALERHYGASLGADMLMRSLELLIQCEEDQSVQPFTENVMLQILYSVLRA